MAAAEVDTRSWKRSGSLALPSVQWHGGSAWLGTILALVFFITALLVPVKYARLIADPPLEISQQVEDLHEQIDVLESEYILSPQQAENKREELDRIAESGLWFKPFQDLGSA